MVLQRPLTSMRPGTGFSWWRWSLEENIMRWFLCLLSAGLVVAAGQLPVGAGDKAVDYLKDGKLRQRLEVHEMTTDPDDIDRGPKLLRKSYVVEPDGSWSIDWMVPRREVELGLPNAKGKLTEKQLVQLAKELARHDLSKLPSHGVPAFGHIEIRFGNKKSVLHQRPGKTSAEEDKAIRARYDGIVQTVKTLCQATNTPRACGEVKDYLTDDGKLKATLTFAIVEYADDARRVQSEKSWVIESTGEWTLTTSGINFGIRPAIPTVADKGKLTAPQLAALAQHLATQNFNQCTAELGVSPASGIHGTSISFGKKTTTLLTAKGSLTAGLPKAGDPKADDWSRFVAVTLVLQNLLQPTSADPKVPDGRGRIAAREIPLKSARGPFTAAEKPTKITSADDLMKTFPDDDQIAKNVDFTKEMCLFFAWKGSGADKVSVHIKDDKGIPVVEINYITGKTADLKPHYRLFVIPKNATWRSDDLKGVQKLKLSSGPIVTGRKPIGLAIELDGKGGDKGTFAQDPNSYDEKGLGTLIGWEPVNITLKMVKDENADKKGRLLYEITGSNLGRMLLVIPANSDGPCWLVFAGKEAVVDIISLQRK